METKFKQMATLFFIFLKIGALTFGGGYAMLPIIYDALCEKNKYLNEDEMDKIIVISQSLPGVMSVNCALQVGYRFGGLIGGLTCMIGVILPSLLIIMALTGLIIKYRSNEIVENTFFMIRSAVVGLITVAALKMVCRMNTNKMQLMLVGAAIIIMVSGILNPIFMIIAGGIVGLFITRKGDMRL